MATAQTTTSHYRAFDFVEFWVGNALQAASFYQSRFGFKKIAYKGLETGDRKVVSHVVRANKITLVFSSALQPNNKQMGDHLVLHGDGVRDVAFLVDDSRSAHKEAVSRGAVSVRDPEEVSDEFGSAVLSSVHAYADTIHTFVERHNYKGPFLPGFRPQTKEEAMDQYAETPILNFIDHVVSNQPENQMLPTEEWYEKVLQFHRFWSVDDSQICTEYSALRSVVVASADEGVKMPINEPAAAKKKSQIQEYVEFYGGAGIQHIALNTDNIIQAITWLKKRGVEFLSIPATYYEHLRSKLAHSPIKVSEDLDVIQKLDILIDYDDKGYLLQIFTKPVEDRPTLFFEVIQRRNHQGFGIGNFKSLFEAIEAEQAKRGNC